MGLENDGQKMRQNEEEWDLQRCLAALVRVKGRISLGDLLHFLTEGLS